MIGALIVVGVIAVLALVHTLGGFPTFGMSRRCGHYTVGAWLTEWRCLRDWRHDNEHIYEPDLWPGGSHHESFVAVWREAQRRRAR